MAELTTDDGSTASPEAIRRFEERNNAVTDQTTDHLSGAVTAAEQAIAALYNRPEECATERESAEAAVKAVEQAIRTEERVKVLGEVREALAKQVSARRALADEYEAMGALTGAAAYEAAANSVDAAMRSALATLDQEGPCETRCGGKQGAPKLVETPGVDEPYPMQATCPGCSDCLDQEDEAPVPDQKRCSGSGQIWCGPNMPNTYQTCPGCPDCTEQVVEEGELAERRDDPEFRDRLRRSIDENRELLDRLAEGDEVADIARAFHDEYEAWARAHGWETQKEARTSFDDLPTPNRLTMLATVRALLDRHIISLPAPQGVSGGGETDRLRRALRDVNAHIGVSTSSPTEEAIRAVVESALRLADEERATQNQSTDTVPSGGAADGEELAQWLERSTEKWPEQVRLVRRPETFFGVGIATRTPAPGYEREYELETTLYVPLETIRERLEAEADKLEEVRDLGDAASTARAVRCAKAQGIRDALAAAFKEDTEHGDQRRGR
jgi:hypothetical protein